MRRAIPTLAAALAAALLVPASAAAVPDCADKPPVRTLLSGQAVL